MDKEVTSLTAKVVEDDSMFTSKNIIFKGIKYSDIESANKDLRKINIVRENKKTNEVITKEYIPVSERIKAFRKVYPEGFIDTIIECEDNTMCRFRAIAYQYEGGPKLAIARAQEIKTNGIVNQTSMLENCETSAIGRVLGMCGFGIDTELATAEEIQSAQKKQEELENLEITEEQVKIIANMDEELKSTIRNFYGRDPLKLSFKEAEEAIKSAYKRGLLKTPKEQKIEKIEKEIKEKNEEEVF